MLRKILRYVKNSIPYIKKIINFIFWILKLLLNIAKKFISALIWYKKTIVSEIRSLRNYDVKSDNALYEKRKAALKNKLDAAVLQCYVNIITLLYSSTINIKIIPHEHFSNPYSFLLIIFNIKSKNTPIYVIWKKRITAISKWFFILNTWAMFHIWFLLLTQMPNLVIFFLIAAMKIFGVLDWLIVIPFKKNINRHFVALIQVMHVIHEVTRRRMPRLYALVGDLLYICPKNYSILKIKINRTLKIGTDYLRKNKLQLTIHNLYLELHINFFLNTFGKYKNILSKCGGYLLKRTLNKYKIPYSIWSTHALVYVAILPAILLQHENISVFFIEFSINLPSLLGFILSQNNSTVVSLYQLLVLII